jgi:rod shape-determining protein MreC
MGEERLRYRLNEKRFQVIEAENQRLRALLRLDPIPSHRPLAARVLARDSSDWFHSLLVRRGRRDGVQLSDPVIIVQEGREVLLGQVVEIFERNARVLLIMDPLSAVSSQVSRTAEQGVTEGQGLNSLAMDYLPSDSDVREGDEVVTAGLGQIFPQGILLGHVVSVEPSTRESFKRVYLFPSARLNRLQEVLILLRT